MSAAPRPPPSAATLVRSGQPVPGAGFDRFLLDQAQWAGFAERLATDPLPLAGLWSDGREVHALLGAPGDAMLAASVAVERQRFLALSTARPAASVQERMIRDLWGIEAMAARDLRPWLDHGVWGLTAPLAALPGPASWPPEPPEFLWDARDEAAGAFQLPIGPVQTLTIGPAQFRLTLRGERVTRAEPLFGFAHRGIARALRGLDAAASLRLVARIDATASVAHQLAFARAVESTTGWVPDRGTESLRRAMGAIERIALQLHHLGVLWSGGGHRGASRLARSVRAMLLAQCEGAFGHRLMMTGIGVGGWSRLPDASGLESLRDGLRQLPARLDPLPDRLPGQDRLLAIERDGDIARNGLDPLVVPHAGGDGPWRSDDRGGGEGLAMAESALGPLWHWVRLERGLVVAWHGIDPALAALETLMRQAVGLTAEEFRALVTMRGVSVAGADQ